MCLTACSFQGPAATATPGDGDGDGDGDGGAQQDGPTIDAPASGTRVFVDGPGYTGTRDTFLSAMFPDTAQGAAAFIKWELDVPEAGLLRFDDMFGTAADQVPAGATITSATLAFTVFDQSDANGDGSVVESAIAWDEATVTHDTFGGDAGIQGDEQHPEIIADLPTRTSGLHELDVTASVERWSKGVRDNHGWLLISGNGNDELAHSSEATDPEQRPSLTVSFTVP